VTYFLNELIVRVHVVDVVIFITCVQFSCVCLCDRQTYYWLILQAGSMAV